MSTYSIATEVKLQAKRTKTELKKKTSKLLTANGQQKNTLIGQPKFRGSLCIWNFILHVLCFILHYIIYFLSVIHCRSAVSRSYAHCWQLCGRLAICEDSFFFNFLFQQNNKRGPKWNDNNKLTNENEWTHTFTPVNIRVHKYLHDIYTRNIYH